MNSWANRKTCLYLDFLILHGSDSITCDFEMFKYIYYFVLYKIATTKKLLYLPVTCMYIALAALSFTTGQELWIIKFVQYLNVFFIVMLVYNKGTKISLFI